MTIVQMSDYTAQKAIAAAKHIGRHVAPTHLPVPRSPDPLMNDVIDLIHVALKAGQHTVFSIATAAGVSPGMIKNWLEGITKRPQAHSLRLVAEVFGYELKLVRK